MSALGRKADIRVPGEIAHAFLANFGDEPVATPEFLALERMKGACQRNCLGIILRFNDHSPRRMHQLIEHQHRINMARRTVGSTRCRRMRAYWTHTCRPEDHGDRFGEPSGTFLSRAALVVPLRGKDGHSANVRMSQNLTLR